MAVVSRTPTPPAAPRATTLHDVLVQRGGRWLRKQGCKIVLTEFRASSQERADVLAWRGTDGPSVLIECKTSRGDFLADRDKPFRSEPARGMGRFRFYLCPPGLIRPDELPDRWGLLYAHPKSITIEAGIDPRRYYNAEAAAFRFEAYNDQAERVALMSALCRLQLRMGVGAFDAAVNQAYDPDRNERMRAQRTHADRQAADKAAWLERLPAEAGAS